MLHQAKGTTFTWNGNAVAELKSINGIECTAKMVDVSSHDTLGNYTKEMPSVLSAGDVALEGHFDSSDVDGQLAMVTDFNNMTKRTGVITFPAATGTTWSFEGYITAIKIGDAPVDGIIPFTATIKPFGKPTFATAISTGLTTPFFVISESAVVTPEEAGDVYLYTASVLTGVTSVTVTPTATAGDITVNGNTVESGEASSAIALGAAGSITLITISVTESGKAPRDYKIYVTRA